MPVRTRRQCLWFCIFFILHKCRIVDEQFNSIRDIIRLFFPAKSPDFNVIEHVWAAMVRDWVSGNERTPDSLERHRQTVQEDIRQNANFCERLVQSMPDRIRECREAQGGYTSYQVEIFLPLKWLFKKKRCFHSVVES